MIASETVERIRLVLLAKAPENEKDDIFAEMFNISSDS